MSDTRKAEQQDVEKFVIEFFDKYPSCCGYPDCDGDLGNGEPHEKECPMYGVEEIPLRAKVVACVTAFAASQVQEQPTLDELAAGLEEAWMKYLRYFGHAPHGTLKQLRAMVEFLPAAIRSTKVGNNNGHR
jgi:hypothetical protein